MKSLSDILFGNAQAAEPVDLMPDEDAFLKAVGRPRKKPKTLKERRREAALKQLQIEYEAALAPQMEGDFLAKLGYHTPGATIKSDPYSRDPYSSYSGLFGTYTADTDEVRHSAAFGSGPPAHEFRHRGWEQLEKGGHPPNIAEEEIMRMQDNLQPDTRWHGMVMDTGDDFLGRLIQKRWERARLEAQEKARQEYLRLFPVLKQAYK